MMTKEEHELEIERLKGQMFSTLQAILDHYKAMQELCAQAADALELHLGYDRERILIDKLRKAVPND
jgi:hypothetical protein